MSEYFVLAEKDNNKTISNYKHYLDSSMVFNRPSLARKIWKINDLLDLHN